MTSSKVIDVADLELRFFSRLIALNMLHYMEILFCDNVFLNSEVVCAHKSE